MLGWADPVPVMPGAPPYEGVIGQAAITPPGTSEGMRINLLPQQVTVTTPRSGKRMWWGNRGNSLDNRLTQMPTDLAGRTAPITFTFRTFFDIEEGWDYGYVEVSTDGGQTWAPLDDVGDLTTNADPHGQNLGNGITGSSDWWADASFDLSAYAGKSIGLRFRYVTDPSVAEDGWFIDDIQIMDAAGVFFTDDVEAGPDGWVATPPDGWAIDDGIFTYPHYYLAEKARYKGPAVLKADIDAFRSPGHMAVGQHVPVWSDDHTTAAAPHLGKAPSLERPRCFPGYSHAHDSGAHALHDPDHRL